MGRITVDEKNKKRIQKYIKENALEYGYENDIALLEEGILTEKLADEVFRGLMERCRTTREIMKPKENDEFASEMEEAFKKYDAIPKPNYYEEYGFMNNYNNLELNETYSCIQTGFEIEEFANRYYACSNLRKIASDAINSINGIDKYKIELEQETKKQMQTIRQELIALLKEPKTNMEAIQDRVDKYNNWAIQIWNNYLTKVDSTNDNEYRWVIHNLTKGELKGDFRDKYMSTSLITNNIMGVYGSSNYGLIIEPKHIVAASSEDAYTNNFKEEDNLFNVKPSIKLPQEIEEDCINQTIKANGEMLNYDNKPIYPEIVVDKYEIKGIYYISNGERELNRNYERARKVAEERGLPLIERDISKYREANGLEPLTDKSKRDLCQSILYRCCSDDKELYKQFIEHKSKFIDKNYMQFYERFMQIKKKENFSSEDILQAFAELTKDDIHFGEIYNQQNLKREKARINEFGEIIREYKPTDLWKNRFNNWYNALDKLSKDSKSKFLKMKSDILHEVEGTLRARDSKNQLKMEKSANEDYGSKEGR